jgi:hypothetical protein
MPEQQLDGPQVGAALEQVDRKGMTQRVRRDRLGGAALAPHDPADVLDSSGRDRLPGHVAGEQPVPWPGDTPVAAQQIQQLRACQSLATGSTGSMDRRGPPLGQGWNNMVICRGVVMRRVVFSVSGRSITVVFKD